MNRAAVSYSSEIIQQILDIRAVPRNRSIEYTSQTDCEFEYITFNAG